MKVSPPIRDAFGRHYVICFSGSANALRARKPVKVSSPQFLRQFKVPQTYWRCMLGRYGFVSRLQLLNDDDVLHQLCILFDRRVLLLYPHPAKSLSHNSQRQLSFKHKDDQIQYQFSYFPLTMHGGLHHVQKFHDVESAEKFLVSLEMTPQQLVKLNEVLAFSDSGQPFNQQALIESLSEKLSSGELLITPQRFIPPPTINPRTDSDDETSRAQTKQAGREPPVEVQNTSTTAVADTNEKPLCQRNSLTVSCSHGRSATLEEGVTYMPTLEVVATTCSGKKPDKITLTSDIIDICDDHKHSHVAVSRDDVKVIQIESGKKSEFEIYGEDLKIRNNPVKYAWLPSIKPQSCTIYPGQSCDDSKRDKMGRGIVVNVYPKVAWDWNVTLGYGSNEQKIEEDENNKGVYKKTLANKRFGITGSVKLTQDNETFSLESEFKEAIESTVKQIDAITNLVDGVIAHFDEGKKPKVTVTWPNLSLNLKTEIAEGKDNYRTIGFDFAISSPTFIGLNVEVDILPVIAKPLDGGIISKWLIEEAQASLQKGVGNKDGLAYLQGDVSVIMKGEGSLGFEAHFQGDFSNNTSTIEKVSGKPVTSKIEFSAEGKVELKGHLLKVKVELVAGVGIKSGITLGIEVDKDAKGYYWKPEAMFNGVRVYITKYVKTKAEIDAGNVFSEFEDEEIEPELKALETNEHVWIEEKKLDTNKRYFIEY